MAYESKLMHLKDLGLLQECEVVLQATRDTGGNLWGVKRKSFSSRKSSPHKPKVMSVFMIKKLEKGAILMQDVCEPKQSHI